MWKIRPGCKNPNQTMVGSLGVIRAKEEPAAASSTASQSPPHTGSPLAGQGRGRGGKTSAHPFICLSGSWALRNHRNKRQQANVRQKKEFEDWGKKITKEREKRIKGQRMEVQEGDRGQSWRKCNKAGYRGLLHSLWDVKWKSPSVSLNIHVFWAADLS